MTDQEQSSSRTWIFVVCGVALLAGAVALLLVLRSGSSEDEDEDEVQEGVARQPGREVERAASHREHEDRRLVVKPSSVKGGLLKSAQRSQHLIRQIKLGGQTNDQILALQLQGKNVQVTVTGPSRGAGKMDGDRWEIMKENLPKFARCYQDRLAQKPGLSGKLVLDIIIKPRNKGECRAVGAVSKSTTIKDFKLQQCILQRLASVPFPKHMIKDANRKPEQYVINLEPTSNSSTDPVTTKTEPEPPPPPDPPPKEESKKEEPRHQPEPPPRDEAKKEEPRPQPEPPPGEEPKEEEPEPGEGHPEPPPEEEQGE